MAARVLSSVVLLMVKWAHAAWRGAAAGLWHVLWLPALLLKSPLRTTLDKHAKHCAKQPQHLAVALVEPAIAYEHLANVVVWSVASNVKFISVWDARGQFAAQMSLTIQIIIKTLVRAEKLAQLRPGHCPPVTAAC